MFSLCSGLADFMFNFVRIFSLVSELKHCKLFCAISFDVRNIKIINHRIPANRLYYGLWKNCVNEFGCTTVKPILKQLMF